MGSQKKKKKRKQKKLFAPLKTKFTQYIPEGQRIVFQPSGEVKMSDVLMDFIKPYFEHCKREVELNKLLTVAMIAWNAALFSDIKKKELLLRLGIHKISAWLRVGFNLSERHIKRRIGNEEESYGDFFVAVRYGWQRKPCFRAS